MSVKLLDKADENLYNIFRDKDKDRLINCS